ncbi:MAG: UvrD-helicase domain-containing protein [Erysipelotrichaceae bacterium]|nr:UvrD-helicase domain-containing protein [Erysipelotrichaceae bacterium]
MRTPSQIAAVTTVNQDVLVSASAGAGKTTVLIDRLIKRIVQDKVPVSRILALTFTEAAAAEMKHRLQAEMHRKLSEVQDPFLEEQLIFLQTANISTIHSFCLTVVKNFGYVINLNPKQVSNILDEATKTVYQKECLDLTFDCQIQQPDASRLIMAAQHFSSRSEEFSDFRFAILKISAVLSQQKDPQLWADQVLSLYQKRNKLHQLPEHIQSAFWQMLTLHAQQLLYLSQSVLQEAIALSNEDSIDEATLISQWVEHLYQSLKKQDLDQYNHALFMMASNPLSTIRKQEDYNKLRKKLNETIKAKVNLFLSEAEYLQHLSNQKPLVELLLEMASDYNQRYNLKKKEKQCIDFDDMERFAFEILFDEQHKIYKNYQELFDEIMVDEFQDTNQLQDAIISRVSKGNNIFRVGDVKQSIYKFRGAKPGLMRQLATKEHIRQLTLEHNYRSKQPIVEFNNQLFNILMNIESFEDIYQIQDHVTPGKESQFEDGHPVEIDILQLEEEAEIESIEIEEENEDEVVEEGYKEEKIDGNPNDKVLRANFIANRMHELHIKENVAYRDMVVLVRSHALKEDLKAAFEEANIPYFIDSKSGFFQSPAISQVMNIYRWITQPANEVALFGILFSPFFHLSADEGAQLAMLNRTQKNWMTSLELLYPNIHQTLMKLKEEFQYLSIVESLNRIYTLNHFFDDYCNHQEKTNLDLLFEKAVNFDQKGIGGIYGFVSLIEKISDEKSSEAIPVNSEDDLVKVMTIHQSKGLQFKVVFYWSTNSNSIIDLKSPIIVDEQLGLGLHTLLLPRRLKKVNLLRQVIEFKATKEELEEQIRVLYVALTRAQEKMIIVGSEKKPPTPKEISMLFVFEKIGTQGWILNALRKLDSSLYVHNRISIEGMRTVRLSMKQSEQPLPVYGKTKTQTSKMIPSLNDQVYIPQIYLSGDMKPKQQGTLMHQALQLLPTLPFSIDKLDRLNIGLTEKMMHHLMAYGNHSFTASLYQLKVSHEVPFMARLDEQLVYGYIDMIAESDDTLIIVDFKTDRNVTQAQLIERHKHQIKTYIQAIALCTQKKIEAYIYSFDLNEYIQI